MACRKLCSTTVILSYTSTHTWHFIYLLPPRNRVLLEKPTVFWDNQSILCKPKFHYHIYECLPCVPTLSHINPVHASTFQFLKIHLNIIPPSMPGSSKQSLSLVSPSKPCRKLSHMCYMARLSPWFAHPNIIGWGVQIVHHFVVFSTPPSLLEPNVLLSTLFSNTLSLHSSLSESNQATYPYKTTAKLQFSLSQSLNLWITNGKTKDSAPNDSQHSLTSVCS